MSHLAFSKEVEMDWASKICKGEKTNDQVMRITKVNSSTISAWCKKYAQLYGIKRSPGQGFFGSALEDRPKNPTFAKRYQNKNFGNNTRSNVRISTTNGNMDSVFSPNLAEENRKLRAVLKTLLELL